MDYNFVPTNTMASVSFDVLKTDGVEDPLINVNRLATIDLEESYFNMAVEYIKESNNEIYRYKNELYKSISEATDQYVVLESFSDFFTKVKDVIDKFLKFIKSLFNRFITSMMSMVSSDKYIIKNKDLLKKFKETDNFDAEVYNFTFKPNVPLANAALDFNQQLFQDLHDKIGVDILDSNAVKTVVKNINFQKTYDEFRANVLNLEGQSISESDFAEVLFRQFRDNQLDTEKIEIDATYVRKAIDRFEGYKKTKSDVERDLKDIERAYNNVKTQVSNITKDGGTISAEAILNRLPDGAIDAKQIAKANSGVAMSGDLLIQLDTYVKAKVDQITEYSNIHTLAYSAKLDALKACYIQDKKVLYTALNKVQRTDAKREVK